MKTLKTLMIASLVLTASMASAGGNNINLRCVGDTNFGDDLDIEVRVYGECEALFGQTAFCESELIFNKASGSNEKGERTKLFVKTVDHTMIYENQIIANFTFKGNPVDLMSTKTPVAAYDNMKVSLNYGGGRGWGEANCKRVRGAKY